MPYTLAKFLLWGIVMALTGGVIGWMLRSLKGRAELVRLRAAGTDHDDVDKLHRRLANLEPVVAERDRLRMELADVRGRSAGVLGFAETPDDPAPVVAPVTDVGRSEPDLDLVEAAAVIGKTIALDDLTAVEGIGPKIAALCDGIGVSTWRQLAETDVETLQSMLDAAGSRFQMHDPATWPRQATLLADGHWTEFKQLTDAL